MNMTYKVFKCDLLWLRVIQLSLVLGQACFTLWTGVSHIPKHTYTVNGVIKSLNL
jgi:hypothetical protein